MSNVTLGGKSSAEGDELYREKEKESLSHTWQQHSKQEYIKSPRTNTPPKVPHLFDGLVRNSEN